MLTSFDLRLLAIFFLIALIIGCQQQPIEELHAGSPDNAPEKVGPRKQVRFVSEPISEQDTTDRNKMAKQSKDTQSKEAPQLEGKGANNFCDNPTAHHPQEKLPPPPINELLTPPVPPINISKEFKEQSPEGSTNQEESTKKLEEIPLLNKEEGPNTYPTNNEQEKDTPPKVTTPAPFACGENDIPQPWPSQDNPSKIAEKENKPKKDFPTITQLNIDLGIDVSTIDISTLGQKGIPELKNEFEKIQQAYEAVKQAYTVNELTEEAKLRLNEEVFLLNKPRKIYYEVVKAQVKKQKEDLLNKVEEKLKSKKEELRNLKQDIENGESTTSEELSAHISEENKKLEELRNQVPKVSQFKNRLLEYNKVKQEVEGKIDEKEKFLKLLKKQQDGITQKVATQIAKFDSLEKEIAKLEKEEPTKIENSFNKQIQELEDIFNKQTSSGKKDLVSSMFGNMVTRISQLQEQEKKEEKLRSDEEWD